MKRPVASLERTVRQLGGMIVLAQFIGNELLLSAAIEARRLSQEAMSGEPLTPAQQGTLVAALNRVSELAEATHLLLRTSKN